MDAGKGGNGRGDWEGEMMGDFGAGDKRIAREYCIGGLCTTVVCIFMNCGAGCVCVVFFPFLSGEDAGEAAVMHWGVDVLGWASAEDECRSRDCLFAGWELGKAGSSSAWMLCSFLVRR